MTEISIGCYLCRQDDLGTAAGLSSDQLSAPRLAQTPGLSLSKTSPNVGVRIWTLLDHPEAEYLKFTPSRHFHGSRRFGYQVEDIAPNRVINGLELNEPEPPHWSRTALAHVHLITENPFSKRWMHDPQAMGTRKT